MMLPELYTSSELKYEKTIRIVPTGAGKLSLGGHMNAVVVLNRNLPEIFAIKVMSLIMYEN